MPDPRKVRWSKLRVGIVGASAFIILFVLVFLLTSAKGIFQQYATLRTYMDDASGLGNGTAVRLNGITVGYLDKLQLTGSRDPKRTVEFVHESAGLLSAANTGGFPRGGRRGQSAGR